MEEIQNNTDETLADVEGTPTADGGANVEKPLREVIGGTLNREFKTDEDALKAIKETQDFVGKRDEDIRKEIKASYTEKTEEAQATVERLAKLEAEVKNSSFYNDHPEYKEHKDLIAKFGENPSEVIASDDFKKVYEPLKAYQENEQSKSVLHSNPRLGKANDKITEARELAKKGNFKGAEDTAVNAVLDVFEN